MRKLLPIILGIALLLTGGLLLFHLRQPPTEAEVLSALDAVRGEEYYTFREQCILTVNGEERDYFTLIGERAGENVHLSGTVLGTPAELYLVDSVLYQQLPDGTWLINTFPDVEQAVSLFTELDPASTFPAAGTVTTAEKGGKATLTPTDAGWIGDYFRDIRCSVQLDRRGDLTEALITGTLREDGASELTLSLIITERKENLTVEAPQTE